MSASGEDISVDRLAGQLRYLFEDHPDLRTAPIDDLVTRLNHDDRFARARQKYPLDSDDEIRDRVSEFPDRISAEQVRDALRQVEEDRP